VRGDFACLWQKNVNQSIMSLAAENVLLIHLVPDGKNVLLIYFGPWRRKMFY
jgi:hypothetical protein